MLLYAYDWSVVLPRMGQMLQGLAFSIQIAVLALACALVLGLIVAVCRLSSFRPLSLLAFGYVQFFRALSIYIYILWVYFGLAAALNISLSPLEAAVVSLSLLNSAYMAEIYRAAIKAIDPGQREAALSLGLSPLSAFLNVTLPQAFRIAVPALMNQFADLVKDSAIVAVIGAADLMFVTIDLVSYSGRPFEFYTITALIYLTIILTISSLAGLLERRLRAHLA